MDNIIYVYVAIGHIGLHTSEYWLGSVGKYCTRNSLQTVVRGCLGCLVCIAMSDYRLYWWRPPVVTQGIGELGMRS